MQEMKTEKQPDERKGPSKQKIFWRIQRECLRRSVTVYLMYLFMGLIMLACQAIHEDTTALEIVLGVACILIGMAFNVHLCYHAGCDHYDAYVTGCAHRKNALFGIDSGANHRVEREYRPYKGFLIGFYAGLIVIVLGILAGIFQNSENNFALLFLTIFAGCSIIPVTWVIASVGSSVSCFWSLLFVLVPIIVSGIAYIVGAKMQRNKKFMEKERMQRVEEAARRAREEAEQHVQETHVQTEEQRKKTAQSKKKK